MRAEGPTEPGSGKVIDLRLEDAIKFGEELESFDIDAVLRRDFGHEPMAREVVSPHAAWSLDDSTSILDGSAAAGRKRREAQADAVAAAVVAPPVALPEVKPPPMNPMAFDWLSASIAAFVGGTFAVWSSIGYAAIPFSALIAIAWARLGGYRRYGGGQ